MTQTYDEPETYILVICDLNEHISVAPPNLHGPFETMLEAQEYARDWRAAHNIPGHNVEPTPEENEAWTDAGWYFGIFTPITLPREQMFMESTPEPGQFLITVKGEDGGSQTADYADILLNSDELPYANRPTTVEELRHALGCVLNRSYEWNDENEAKMKQWYDAVEALDDESYFPVHIGPTPDGLTILIEKGKTDD